MQPSTSRPTFSLVVPTRRRTTRLRKFLDSVAATAAHIDSIEVILVVDSDDPESVRFRHGGVPLKLVVGPPGRTMGALNSDGYEASSGEYVMLLNDDVVARTRRWDEQVLGCLPDFPDGVVLVHVNDTLFRESLCTFPLVSRTFCELAGGICPRDYVRYRIDDHVEDVFNLLAALGERRTVYLPDVIFEHFNFTDQPAGHRLYQCDPASLALDVPRFDALFAERKELVLRLLEYMHGRQADALRAARRKLELIHDPFSLRDPARLRVVPTAPLLVRARRCLRHHGVRGLARALGRRGMRLLVGERSPRK